MVRAMHSMTNSPSILDTEIRRIIGNARQEHNRCVLARKRYGLEEFGRLYYLLEALPGEQLEAHLDFLDEVRATHDDCGPCSMKFIAFCRFYCGSKLPARLARYEKEYSELHRLLASPRDFMDEVQYAIDCQKPRTYPRHS